MPSKPTRAIREADYVRDCDEWKECVDVPPEHLRSLGASGGDYNVVVHLEMPHDDKPKEELRAFKVFDRLDRTTMPGAERVRSARWEVTITEWLGELGIGAEVVDVFLTASKHQLVMVLRQYDGSLWHNNDKFERVPRNIDVLEQRLDVLFTHLAENGLFCTDLKPQNVVLNFDGDRITDVRLIDFDTRLCDGSTPSHVSFSGRDNAVHTVAHKIIFQWNSWFLWKKSGYAFRPLFSTIHEHPLYREAITEILDDETAIELLMPMYASTHWPPRRPTENTRTFEITEQEEQCVRLMLEKARDYSSAIEYEYPLRLAPLEEPVIPAAPTPAPAPAPAPAAMAPPAAMAHLAAMAPPAAPAPMPKRAGRLFMRTGAALAVAAASVMALAYAFRRTGRRPKRKSTRGAPKRRKSASKSSPRRATRRKSASTRRA